MEIVDENFKELVEKSAKILGFQDCVIELLGRKMKGEDINSTRLSDLVEDYKKQLNYSAPTNN